MHCTPEVYTAKVHKIDPKRKELAIIHYNYDSIESFVSRMNRYSTLELEKYTKRNIRFSVGYAINRSFGEFIKRYILKKGFLDGTHGFIFSVMMAYYKFISIAKLWEHENKQS